MISGYRRFFPLFFLLVFLSGSSPGITGKPENGQIGKPGKTALGKYLSSVSGTRDLFTGVEHRSAGVSSRKEVPRLFGAVGGMLRNGLLRDTLSVLTDMSSQIWFEEGTTWLNEGHTNHAYDAEGRRVQTTVQTWLNNDWQNTFQLNFHYDGIGTLRRVIGRSWNGGTWVDNSLDTLYYDANGNISQEFVRVYNGSSWLNAERFFISFDSAGRPTERHRESWTGSSWQNVERYLIDYTPAGMMSEVIYQTWVASDWANNLRDTYSYDGAGNLTEEYNQYWSGGSWKDDTRYLSTFDVDNFLTEVVEQYWNLSSWVNDSKQILNNDLDGHPTEIVIQYWSGIDWANDAILYHTYDGPNIVEDYYVTWNGTMWVGMHITTYTWVPIITPDETTQKYPVNPAWNLVSVPLDVGDYAKTALFPTSSSSAFFFDAGYTAAATLENGRGYWLKFDSAQAVPMTGMMRTVDTIDVSAGWNLVGSIGTTITASGVGSVPGGLVISGFFGFDAGYQASGIIEPGKAYWVKVAEAGKIIMNSTGNIPAAARVRIEPTEERPPSPPEEPAPAETLPVQTSLDQNYPNPFNPVTEISFNLNEPARVRITVYNVIGREVAVLVDGFREAGTHSVSFDGGKFPSGVYFYTMTTDAWSGTRRMILLK